MPIFGFSDNQWVAAKMEAKEAIVAQAKVRDMITYSELVQYIKSILFAAHDPRLSYMLDEISTEEDSAGRGLFTVIVVHKHGDKQPGLGFFKLVEKRGRDTTDQDECWIKELNKVYAYWETQ